MERNSNYYIQIVITPFFFLLSFFFITCLISAAAITSTTTDQLALLSLKSKITSDPHNNIMQNWTLTSPVCDWIGVTCGNRHHRVTYLNISYMSLTGQIPPQLGNLSFLISLDMAGNDFFGLIPSDLSRLRRLRFLRISVNRFSGEVPSCFAFLPRLESLYLYNNSFTSMDSFLISLNPNQSNLAALGVSYNSLQGKIPESIGNLRGIEFLNMGGNKLSGSLPSSLANLTSLGKLSMHDNYIEGSLPEAIGNLPNLGALDLQYNQLTGLIPSSLFNLSALEILELTENSLSGTLPDDMCLRLPYLGKLALSGNKLYGEIPSNISLCSELEILSLSVNSFTGSIPDTIGNLKSLQELYLGTNNLTGEIPYSLGELEELEILNLAINRLSGLVPTNINNITSLSFLSLAVNNLSGNLPSKLGYSLPNLEILYLNANGFGGDFPNYILNCSKLIELDVSHNELTGPIPTSLGNLKFLEVLNVARNGFTSDLSFINSLTNCRYLNKLFVSQIPLLKHSVLPTSIGNLSSSLTQFESYRCSITGHIPEEIGNLSGLVYLHLGSNDLSGEIPVTLHNLVNLQRLVLEDNRITGLIPSNLCELMSLESMYLDVNQLIGPIPEFLGNISSLRELYLNNNNLTSDIPSSMWNLKDLLNLSISSNSFTGSLSPQVENLKAAILIDLSMNRFSGNIPSTFGSLTQLQELYLTNNDFHGPIPESMGSMISLVSLDLAHNKLNGTIPKSLEKLQNLENFNVSYNDLSGEIPGDGPFENFTSRSFMFNNGALCGPSRFDVSSCTVSQHKSTMKKIRRTLLISLGIGGFIIIICLAYAAMRCRRKVTAPVVASDDITATTGRPKRFSYYELLHSTENYSENNLLGNGSFGSVYKGVLRDGTILAVKVFHIQLEGSSRSFEVECEVLRNLRHRNLVKVLGSCTNQDFKAIVLEYMQHGSLERCLHSGNQCLDIMQRLDIMIDVASALEYLHHGYSTSVVHCDLKPGNVLLDENMVAHVGDFGITKYLNEGESNAHTRTLATLGYMAPEYGSEGIVSTRCDVYSYGIMLLETFTGKRPSDEMFSGEVTLKDWVNGSIPSTSIQVIDPNLISHEETDFSVKLRCIFSVLELGLNCSANLPGERKNMKDVSAELKKIKMRLIADIGSKENATKRGSRLTQTKSS